MNNNKKKALVSAILTIALCFSVIAGATFALFTSKDEVNIAVTSGKVNLTATIDTESLKLSSLGVDRTNEGKFAVGGTATFDNERKLNLTNIVPGDKATFEIDVTNNSNVDVMYKLAWKVDNTELDALVATATVENETEALEATDWIEWKTPATDAEKTKTIVASIELPREAGDDYQDKAASVSFTVEAVQANAVVDSVETEDQLLAALAAGVGKVELANDLTIEDTIQVAGDVTIDLNDKTLKANIEVGDDAELVLNNGKLSNENGDKSAIQLNGGNATLTDVEIVSARHGVRVEGGTLVINDGYYTVASTGKTQHAVNVGGAAEPSVLIINGGTFVGPRGTTADSGSAVNVQNNATATINGGNFSGGKNNTISSVAGATKIYGGTFDQDPTKYVAEYFVVADNNDGTYTVAQDPTAFFVNDDAELAAAIELINSDSTYYNKSTAIILEAGTYSGTYNIKQYPSFNGSNVSNTKHDEWVNTTFVAKEGALFTGHITLNGSGNGQGSVTNHPGTTFKGFTFDATNSDVGDGTRRNIYLVYGTDNVLFEDCTFKNATHINVGGAGTTSVFNTTFDGCTFDNGGCISGYWPGSTGAMLTLKNCTGEMGDNGIANSQKAGFVVLENCNLSAGSYGFRTNSGLNITVKNSTLTIREAGTAYDEVGALVVFRGTNSSLTLENSKVAYQTLVVYKDASYKSSCKIEIDGVKQVMTEKLTTNEAIDEAIENGYNAIVLGDGNYIIPDSAQGKTLMFIGNGNTVVATQDDGSYEGCDYSLDGSNVVFEGIVINTDSRTYTGYARLNATYNNCTINGTYTLYGNSVFNNCTFNIEGDLYNIWTWGAPTAEFNNCTFNTSGKAILLYGGTDTKLIVNNCVFNDDNAYADVNNKAAIEVGSDWTTDKKEVIVTNTTVNGFDITNKGTPTGTTLWGNKNSLPTGRLNVVVDGVDVY